MNRKIIAVITGGKSSENEVSKKSAKVIFENIDDNLFEKYIIDIRGNDWVVDKDGTLLSIDKNDFSLILDGKKIYFDCVYIMTHGNPGENGKLQGYLDMLDVPYTNCNSLTSAITFNKDATKNFLSKFTLNLAKSITLKKSDSINVDEIIEKIGLPFFVKPCEGGSSIGITKVKRKEDLKQSIEIAFKSDKQVIIEEFISGRELTCGVFSYNGEIIKFPVTEIITNNEFFDYEAKYSGKTLEVTPANIDEALKLKCQEQAAYVYDSLSCKGVCRVDFICDKDDNLWVLEINTVPGMSEESIIPKQAKALGISFKELCTMTINEALNEQNK